MNTELELKSKDIYDTLMESAKRIGKAAEEEALQADLDSTLSERIVNIIREEGINKLILPKRYGGPQINFTTFADMVKQVGEFNPLEYHDALRNLQPTQKQQLVLSLTKEDPKLYQLFEIEGLLYFSNHVLILILIIIF